MTTCTPIYQLPYQEGGDRPCDAPEVWCDFAEAVEAELDRIDGVVLRTSVTIPLAKVSLSAPQTYDATTSGSVIAFDTVHEDTDGMVDFQLAPGEIRPQRSGLYSVRCYIELGTTGSTSNSFIFQLQGVGPVNSPTTILPTAGNNPIIQFPDPNLANSMTYCLRSMWRVSLPDSRFFPTITYGSISVGATAQLTRAEMDVYWMAD